MPEPLIKTWGPLKLSKTAIAATDTSLSATDKEHVFRLSTIDCFPSPNTTTEYVKPSKIAPTVKPASLQASEAKNLNNIKQLFGGKPSTALGVQTAIETQLALKSMLISYASTAYKALHKPHRCFTNDIYLRVQYDVYEIKVSAATALNLGGDAFAAGDEIITYRIRQAAKYRFESHLSWNPKCCAQKPTSEPEASSTDYYAALDEALIEEIVVTGKRLKANGKSAKAAPIPPASDPFRFELGLGYKHPLDEPEIDLDWSKYLKED